MSEASCPMCEMTEVANHADHCRISCNMNNLANGLKAWSVKRVGD